LLGGWTAQRLVPTPTLIILFLFLCVLIFLLPILFLVLFRVLVASRRSRRRIRRGMETTNSMGLAAHAGRFSPTIATCSKALD
jgi:hypothetical protein